MNIYQEAFELFQVDQDDETSEHLPGIGYPDLPAIGQPIPKEMKEAISKFVAKNQNALARLHEASAMKLCRYPVDLTQGYETQLCHLVKIRSGSRLLKLEAVNHLEHERPELATRSVSSLLALARSLRNEPSLISQIVRLSFQQMAANMLERILNRTPVSDEVLSSLGLDLAQSEYLEGLKKGLMGERCCVIALFENPFIGPQESFLGKDNDVMVKFSYHLMKMNGTWDKDFLTYLQFISAYVEVLDSSPETQLKQSKIINRQVMNLDHKFLLSNAFLLSLEKAVQKKLRTVAILRAARIALALERHRNAREKLPKELSDLVPTFLEDVPTDPFDGIPLRYKRLIKGYLLYSIGEDGVDDGGVRNKDRDEAEVERDIRFKVER